MRAYAERAGLKLGAVAQPLRAALTGRTTSPPIFDVLAVLGRRRKPWLACATRSPPKPSRPFLAGAPAPMHARAAILQRTQG